MAKLIEQNNEKMVCEMSIPISLANAIRRSVNYIPTTAVEELEITKNDSALYDEVISHRLGLVPLKDSGLKLMDECTCKGKGCGKCKVQLSLKAKGPGIITSGQISPSGSSVYDMPITLLNKDQELEFVATAVAGKGVDHNKFCPGLLYYTYSDEKGDETDEEHTKLVEEGKAKEDKELKLTIESWGQIPAKDIFIKAVEALNKNLTELSKNIK